MSLPAEGHYCWTEWDHYIDCPSCGADIILGDTGLRWSRGHSSDICWLCGSGSYPLRCCASITCGKCKKDFLLQKREEYRLAEYDDE